MRPGDRQGWEWWAVHECSHDYFETHHYRDAPTAIAIHGYEPTLQTDLPRWVEKPGDSAPLRGNPESNDRPAF